MQFYGKVIVIRRNGMDGASFPLMTTCCLFGRDQDCDVRIQLPTVDTKHCEIDIDDKGHAFIKNVSTTSATIINDKVLSNSLTALSHGDVITIADRNFRFEFPENSRFYPQKSPKAKSPKTPKKIHTPKTGSAEKGSKMLRRSSPVSPLSPRTDNVPQSSKSSQSAKKNIVSEPLPATEVSAAAANTPVNRSSGSQKKGSASPNFLFGLSPAAFYTASNTSRAVKNLSDSQPGKMSPVLGTPSTTMREGSTSQTSSKPAANKQRSPGSPYSKTPANLRKSITDLRRRSVPVFETDEDSSQIPAPNRQEDVTAAVNSGTKRKASDFGLMSAKRKRVSFGPNLSPEHFDKTLPPKTPIKKGATPGRINRQERKSLLKMKSQRGKSTSPNGPTPSKKVSPLKTPVKVSSSQVGVYIEVLPSSATVEIAESVKPQSPRSRPQEPSLSLRTTPKTTPEKKSVPEISTEKPSPNKKSLQSTNTNTPKGNSASPVFSDELTRNSASGSVLIPPLSFPKMMSPVSVLAVCSPLPQKVPSPALQAAAAHKSATPRRSSYSLQMSAKGRISSSIEMSATARRSGYSLQTSATPRSGLSATPRRSSSSPQQSATPRSSSYSFQKSTTPRRSSPSPQNSLTSRRSSPAQTPGRSSSSLQKSPTHRRSSFSPQNSTIPRRSSFSPKTSPTPRRSNSYPKNSPTPRRSSSYPKNSPTPRSSPSARRSSSYPKNSPTPRRSSPSPTPRRSSSSPQKSVTPRRSSSSPQKSVTPRRSGTFPQKSVTPRRSGSSLQKSVTPRSGSSIQVSPSPRPSLSSPQKSTTPRSKENLALPQNIWPQVPFSGQGEKTPLRAITAVSPANLLGTFGSPVSPHMQTESQDLFSQVSPKTVGRKSLGGKLASPKVSESRSPSLSVEKLPTPKFVKRMSRSPKQKHAHSVQVSPTAIKRIMKTPKEKRVAISAVSPTGIINLVKTPRMKRVNHAVSTPSGLKRLLKTPKHKQILEASLIGIKEMMKTPRTSGVSAFLSTPSPLKQGAASLNLNSNNATPLLKNLVKPFDTPRPIFSEKRNRSPKIFFDETQLTKSLVSKKLVSAKSPAVDTSSPAGKRSVGRPPSAKKMLAKLVSSSAEKIVSPPQDFNKVVALRAIHGHVITPKIVSLKVGTPKSNTKQVLKSARKTPYKKTWSDIVKSGAQKPAAIKSIPLPARGTNTKRKSPSLKNVAKIPKTPRTIARALAPTTGHVDSPATIIVGKKALGRMQTQKPLPRKGRKQSLSKASRKSAGNTSFTGLAEMFTEQAEAVLSESGLYADIPDTPNGPNEMFVSPLSNRKQSLGVRRSTNLVGVRELFMKKGHRKSDFTGVKELFVSSNTASIASPSGLERLMKTPKKLTKVVTPTEFGRLLKTPKTKSLLVSPAGLDLLFKTPVSKETSSPQFGISTLKQAQESPKSQSNKSGAISKKRRAEDSIRKPAPKKIRLSPAEEVRQITIDKPTVVKMQSKVQIVKISPSPPKSTSRGRPRKLQIIESVPVGETAAYILDGKISPKSARRGRKSKEHSIAATPSPPKTIGRGRQSEVQIIEAAAARDELIKISADEESAPSPPKSASRQGAPSPLKSASRQSAPSPLKSASRQSAPSPPKSASRQSAPSPLKSASRQSAPSPPKSAGRGRPRKLLVKESAPVEQTVKDVPTAPSPFKPSGRGRRGQVQIVKSSPLNKIISLSAVVETVAPPAKTTGRGRPRKVEAARAEETAKDEIAAQSSPKTTGRGRKDKILIVEKTAPLAVNEKTVSSPLKPTGPGRRRKVVVFVASPSPPKITGRGRRSQFQIVKLSPLNKITPRSPAKTIGRGRRGKVDPLEVALVEETAKDGQANPSSPKTTGRDRRGQVHIGKSYPLKKIILLSPPKITRRGRIGTFEASPVKEIATLSVNGKTVLSPPKATGRGRRGKAVIFEAAPSPKTTGRGRRGKIVIFEATSSPKTTGRGGKDKALSIEAAPVKETGVNGKAGTSPPKTTGRGRRGKVVIFEAASSPKTTGSGRKNKALIIETAAVEETAVKGKAVPSPPKTADRGKQGKVVILETVPSPPKATGRGRRAKVLLIKSPLNKVTPIADEKAVPSPHKTGRGRSMKKDTTLVASSATLVRQRGATIDSSKPESTTKKEESPETERIPSPAKSRGSRRGHILTSKTSLVDESVSSVPAKQMRGGKRKAGVTTNPTPEKKVKMDSPFQISQAKPKIAKRGRAAQVTPVKGSTSLKNVSTVVRGLAKKPIDVASGNATTAVQKASPVKSRRGQLKKTEVKASPVMRKQGRPKAAVFSPKPVSALSKKVSKEPKTSSRKPVTLAKTTVATRQRKRQ